MITYNGSMFDYCNDDIYETWVFDKGNREVTLEKRILGGVNALGGFIGISDVKGGCSSIIETLGELFEGTPFEDVELYSSAPIGKKTRKELAAYCYTSEYDFELVFDKVYSMLRLLFKEA